MIGLDTLTRELDYEGGVLFPTSESPGRMRRADWVDKGEWLAAAKRAGAEKLFFVQDNPVVALLNARTIRVNESNNSRVCGLWRGRGFSFWRHRERSTSTIWPKDRHGDPTRKLRDN